ncbi:MAG TPA: glutathione S-transferase N-terminal domain-containing protein [Hyphomicrobiaceae bacterium]|nr:glutathione S-transferase N-terminal domain-containing protein [Hyphomicrobiaceae bacterium]
MKLLIAAPSPYARKARVALHERGIAFTEEVTIPWNKGTTAPDHNPLGKIPVLILDDGRAIYDSRVIVEYVDTLPGSTRLIPDHPAQRIQVKLIEAIADGVADAIVLILIESRRKANLQSRDWVARQRSKVDAGMAELSRQLGEQAYYVGDRFTLADIAAGAVLAYAALRYPDSDWATRFPNLEAYSARMEARSSFEKTRPGPQFVEEIG